MGLHEKWHGAHHLPGAAQHQDLRQPPGAAARASRLDQRRQEFMADERLLSGEGIPFRRVDAGERVDDPDTFHR